MVRPNLDLLAERLDARRTKPMVRERILRLNPDYCHGEIPRGWHPADTASRNRLWLAMVSKGWIIRKFGRETWERIPRQFITKRGRRCYVSHSAIEDRIWEHTPSTVRFTTWA